MGFNSFLREHKTPPLQQPVLPTPPPSLPLGFCQLLLSGKHPSCAKPHSKSANQNLRALFGPVLSAWRDRHTKWTWWESNRALGSAIGQVIWLLRSSIFHYVNIYKRGSPTPKYSSSPDWMERENNCK